MKKIMTVVGIALFAFGVQAGAIRWSVTNVNVPVGGVTGGGVNSGSDLQNAVVYLFLGTPVDLATMTTSIDDGSFNVAANQDSASTTAAGAIFPARVTGSFVSVSQSAYIVVFTTAYTGAPWTGSFLVGDTITQAFGSTGDLPYTWALSSTTSTWTAVPEPTSMALIALGVAAIGLRRRFKK